MTIPGDRHISNFLHEMSISFLCKSWRPHTHRQLRICWETSSKELYMAVKTMVVNVDTVLHDIHHTQYTTCPHQVRYSNPADYSCKQWVSHLSRFRQNLKILPTGWAKNYQKSTTCTITLYISWYTKCIKIYQCNRDDPLLEINQDQSDWFWDHININLNYFTLYGMYHEYKEVGRPWQGLIPWIKIRHR